MSKTLVDVLNNKHPHDAGVSEEALLHKLTISDDGQRATAEVRINIYTPDDFFTAVRTIKLELA